jgi:hypothetical protein
LSGENSFSAGDFVRLCDKNLAMKGKIFRFRGNFLLQSPLISGSVTNFVSREKKKYPELAF